jgi:4-amino-4-deoxy-L-arabinose transferase-like glycosyltransferase
MSYQAKLHLASFLTLVLFVITGTFLLLRATPEGLGLSDDSIAYIAGARSLLAGNGYREAWLLSNGPVTHFPPGFSSALAFFGWFGLDPLRGARFLNALLFGLNAGLLGVLVWRMTPSLTAGLIIAGLFIANSEMLQVHAVAMSEPLFILFTLCAIWNFDLYFEFPPSSLGRGIAGEWWWLVACGVFSGFAYLTRYAGLALVATFIVATCILRTSWRKRFTSIGIFLAGFLPWAVGWAIRNAIVAGNTTNRAFVWHPVIADNLQIARYQISQFLIPVQSWRQTLYKQPYIIEALTALILGAVLIWTLFKSWNYLTKPRQKAALERGGREAREVISFVVALFIFAYLASIFSAMTLFDAATKFKLRILSPVYVGLFILLVYSGIWLRNRNRLAVILLTFVFLGFSVYKQSLTVNEWARSGLGYASFQWYDSKALAYLRDLPADIKIYTNEPGAVYLYAGRGAVVLPDRYDSATGISRAEDFEKGLAVMRQEIGQGQAVLVLFDHGENVADDMPALTEGLTVTFKAQGDSIYSKP